MHLTLPTRLRPRQWLLATIGSFLSRSPTERTTDIRALRALARDLLQFTLDQWPQSAIAWVSPHAAEYRRRCAALRECFSVSPTYFQECKKLLKTLD